MLTADINKLQFLSADEIDKVVAQGQISITNSGATVDTPQSSQITTSAVLNPYDKKAFVHFEYSVDGGANYNSQDTHLVYSYTITDTVFGDVSILGGLQAAVSVGVGADTIKFRTANGYHSDVDFDEVTYTYTPISQTFLIKYWVYEIQ